MRLKLGLRRFAHALRSVSSFAARVLQFGFDIGEAIALGEAARSAGRRIGGDGESRPSATDRLRATPAAGRASTALARRAPPSVSTNADLRPGGGASSAGAFTCAASGVSAVRQRRIAFGIDSGAGPAHRRRGVDRRFEVVAERGAERLSRNPFRP